MNILAVFLVNQIRTGGDRRYLELLESLAQRGNKVLVFINSYLEYKPQYITKIEIPIKYIRHHFPPASFLFKKNIKKYFRNFHGSNLFSTINFIHIHGDIYLKAALFLRKKLKKPLFYASRCNDIDRAKIIRSAGELNFRQYLFSVLYEQINRNREKQISKFAEIVTFQYSGDRDSFINRTGVSKEKTIIIPGNISLTRCVSSTKNRNTSTSLRSILCIGATSVAKGTLIILKVLERLKQQGFGYLTCTILGNFSDERLLKLINKSIASDMISLMGYSDPFPFLVSHDLLLFPSLFDAYPDTVLEALHTGCPVLASSVGGLPDMLNYPELLFNLNNIEEITNKIKLCVENLDYYLHIKKLCSERTAIHHFNWEEKFEQAMLNYL